MTYIYPTYPVIPATLPPSPISSIYIASTIAYNLTDANDVVTITSGTSDSIVTLHDATTAKKKPYYIKAWSGYNIRIRTIAGNYMEPQAATEIIIIPPATIVLTPLGGNAYWIIL